MDFCQKYIEVNCSISDILNRIEPIEFIDGVLVVGSNILVGSQSIYINDKEINTTEGVLDLPQDSTIDNQPLDGPPFTGDTLELPTYTTIDGYTITTTNYTYFYNIQTSSFFKESDNYLVGTPLKPEDFSYTIYNLTNAQFPFIAPQDCILTSLIFTFVGGVWGNVDYTDATAYIDVIDTNGNITYTGISATIPVCPPQTRYYAETKFEYTLSKDHAVGIRFDYDAPFLTAFNYGCGQFATLGYKFPTA